MDKKRQPRLTVHAVKVLGQLIDGHALSGAEIGRATGLASGTLYPLLIRLEKAGWLTSAWEVADPQALGRPRRRFYRLTAVGKTEASIQVSQFAPAVGRLAWI